MNIIKSFINLIKDLFDKFVVWFYRKKLLRFLRSLGWVTTVIGLPRSGKTTFASYIVHLCVKAKYPVYSSVPIIGALPFNPDDMGIYQYEDSIILYDEASLTSNNRNWAQNFNKASLSFLKLIGHYRVHAFVFSQDLDVDVNWIRLSANILLVKRGCVGVSRIIKVNRELDVNDDTHKLEAFYSRKKGLISFIKTKRIFRPLYYKLFDSWDAPKLKPYPNSRVPWGVESDFQFDLSSQEELTQSISTSISDDILQSYQL